MLEPITKNMTDKSTEKDFRFTFHCDICKSPWDSVPANFSCTKENTLEVDKNASALIWQSEHTAAYERANHEAMEHFNRCPICKRWVCDKCFLILEDKDVCNECAKLETSRSMFKLNRRR